MEQIEEFGEGDPWWKIILKIYGIILLVFVIGVVLYYTIAIVALVFHLKRRFGRKN